MNESAIQMRGIMNPTPRRNGLGRGLASLIPDSALEVDVLANESKGLRTVPLDEIDANPEQPRERFDPRNSTHSRVPSRPTELCPP